MSATSGPGGPSEAAEQLALVPAPGRRRTGSRTSTGPTADRAVAPTDPVATVVVDTPLAHLDRPFEYAVPEDLDADAQPGVRVRVRFAGRDHDGFLLARSAVAEHPGRLAALRTVVSPEPVLTPPVAAAARAVADHYGGTLADVLRLAVPPRHARAERGVPPARSADAEPNPAAPPGAAPPGPARADEPAAGGRWDGYPAAAAFLRRVRAGQAPAAAWTALPGRPPGGDWPAALAAAVAAAVGGGRGAVVVVPDHRDVDRATAAVEDLLGLNVCVRLTADLGPEARYRAFLRLLRGHARVAVGTRSAAWAPVRRPGLLVCWDDGDDLHREARSPYPHVRQVLLERSRQERAALLLGGPTRSVEVQAWVRSGVVAALEPPRELLRSGAPRVSVAGEGRAEERDAAARSARLPSTAWRALRGGLEDGPVLVQVARQGYVVSLTCQDCRTPVRCPRCDGPVGVPGGGQPPACRWCGTVRQPGHPCRACGSPRLRAAGLGAVRTAEELGRAFPGVRVVTSGGTRVVPRVDDRPALVVATPGAEPVAAAGYRAAALMDGWRLLERPSLDAGIEALRRWAGAAALVRRSAGGSGPDVVLCGVPAHAGVPAVEALVRWDPVGLAERELAERLDLGLPPLRRHVRVVGARTGVREAVDELVAAGHDLLGDVHLVREDEAAAVVREGPASDLAAAVRAVRGARSARKAPEVVRLVLDGTDAAEHDAARGRPHVSNA